MITKFIVNPRVPERLRPLLEIAKNVWWVWNRDAVALFSRIDTDLWNACEHNPISLLGRVPPERLASLSKDEAFLAHLDRVYTDLESYLGRKTWYNKHYGDNLDLQVAYFSMEVGLHESLPLYSGGLGVLSGDHLKSADNLGLPFVAISLCYQRGYYRQYLNLDGWQQERYPSNDLYNMPLSLVRDKDGQDITIQVELPGRNVIARIWKAQIGNVPLLLLDTNIPQNAPHDREITANLYGGDRDMRMRQEIVLGIGGLRALDKLGYNRCIYHMNEGHSAFLPLERIRDLMSEGLSFDEARNVATSSTVFTTHTPVPAGNERFSPELMKTYFRDYIKNLGISMDQLLGMGREDPDNSHEDFCMTVLALRLSCCANGVSKLHGEISRNMWKRVWPGVPENEVPIGHITNGIHTQSWIADDFARLYERYLGPKFLEDPSDADTWARVQRIPESELWRAKERLRERLVTYVREKISQQNKKFSSHNNRVLNPNEILDPEALTIGFARRFATYKRANLILRDLPRLRKILMDSNRPVQLIFAGKAHPHDDPGKELIRQIAQLCRDEELYHRVVFLEDYDIDVARHMVQGVDIWLNTPRRPMEASGTSGMKVPINGGVNLSILDGWWCEGYHGDNGWAIGNGEEYSDHEYLDKLEATLLIELLEKEIIPEFYNRGPDGLPREWIQTMKNSISSLSPVFTTDRMVEEYTENMYIPSAIQHQLLTHNNFESARLLTSWQERVLAAWDEVNVLSVEADTTHNLEIGNKLPVVTTLDLGPLDPTEVAVEVIHGELDSNGEITSSQTLVLDFKSASGSVSTFVGEIPCTYAGRNGFAVRVLPFRREVSNKFHLGKVTWWTPDDNSPENQIQSDKILGHVS